MNRFRPPVPPVPGTAQNRPFVPLSVNADADSIIRDAEAGPLIRLPDVGSFIPETNANEILTPNPIFQAMMGFTLQSGSGRTYGGPSAKIARANVTTIDTVGVANPALASRTVDGVNMVARDVVVRMNQADPTQNGLWWLRVAAGGASTFEKLSLLDPVIAEQGVFVLISSGSHANEIWLIRGDGSIAQCVQQQNMVSEIDFTEAKASDYIVSSDNITPTAGNWSRVFKRCVEAACYGGMAFALTYHTMNATEDVPVWTNTEFRANHFLSGDPTAAHITWTGCQGFKVPYPGEAPFSAQIRPVLILSGINNYCVGSTGDGIIAHYPLIIKGALWQDCPGRGCRLDSTVDPAANVNSCFLNSLVILRSGLSSLSIEGGDANVIPVMGCKGINYATLNTPGDNYGFLNRSFLGVTVALGCEWDTSQRINIKDDGTHSLYLKVYTEGGSGITGADISPPSLIIGGNLVLSSAATSTRLPILEGGVSGPSMSTLDMSAGSLSLVDCVESWSRTGGTPYQKKYNSSGGNSSFYTEGFGSTNINENLWASSELSNLATCGVDIGIAMRGCFFGFFLSRSMRSQHVPFASWPTTAVPKFSGSYSTVFEGPRPISSQLWDDPNTPQLLGQIKTNSGSAAYNITTQVVAHPSQSKGSDLVAGNQNVQIAQGSWRRWPTNTATGTDAITLLTTGAQDGHQLEISVESQLFNTTVGGITVLAGTMRALKFQYDSGAWLWRAG